MKKEISVGIIGTGFGKMIGLNFKAVDKTIRVYFSGRDKLKLERVVKEVEADGTYASWKDLVKDPKIDLVVIASHSGGHKEMFDYVVKFGKHVLVEKPAALRSSDVKEMQKVFKTNDKIAVVNHEGRFHPVITYIKEKIESGKLGDIMTLRFGVYTNWYSNPEYKENWNQDKSLGGGQIYSIGSHLIDLARYILNFPEIKSGSVQDLIYQDPRFFKEVTAESQFAAHFETMSGVSIQLYNDCYSHGYKDFMIDVIGSNGVILYSDLRGLKESYSNNEALKEVSWTDPISEVTLGNSILTKSMKYMVKQLVDSIRTGKYDNRFSSLKDEEINLEIFEKFTNKNS